MNANNLLAGGLILVVGLFLIYYLIALIIRRLAERNRFFTIAEEGTAKAVMINDRFDRFVMSFMGRDFTYEVEDNDIATMWRIDDAQNKQERGLRLPFLRGVEWIGFPPFANIHTYRFAWSSLEEVRDEASGELVKRPVPDNKRIDYILVQSDIYVTRIETAECKDKIPLNSNVILGVKVVNPYKALFRIEQWLEATENLVTAKMREYFGSRTYDDLVQLASGESSELLTQFSDVADYVKDKWGVLITSVKISTIDPASKLAEDFIRASTQLYVSQQQALARKAEGQGLADRDTAHFKAISDIKDGTEMYKWQQIKESGLSTYVESGAALATVPVGNGPRRPAPPDDATPTS